MNWSLSDFIDRWRFLWNDPTEGSYYGQMMLSGWGYTVAVTAIALIIALVFGFLIGTLRTVQGRPLLSGLATAWVEVFRNIPILVQLFIWYQVLPVLIPPLKDVSGFALVVCGLGFFTSARIAEQVRAGILSLPSGQRNAGLALGLSQWQCYRYVILPMALRIILPPLTSESMNLVKNSSVAFAVSVPEIVAASLQIQEETSRSYEIYIVATILYVITAMVIYYVMSAVEKKIRIPGLVAGREKR